ncbi:MAG: hypothetical protein K9M51_03770 [Candidatus Gracilibacteria bacterium]|nr:hypothetical protein [Candidatus Gracilibacteria bacterium]
MKKSFLVFGSLFFFALVLTGCGSAPTTDAELAQKYGLTLEEFQEQKEAAARMNMSIETHLKNGHVDSMDMPMDH